NCGCDRFMDESSSRICRVAGHVATILRGYRAASPRRLRGRRILVPTRGKACPVLNMMSHTLPPLWFYFIAPLFQLRGDGLNPGGLFNRFQLDASGLMHVVL